VRATNHPRPVGTPELTVVVPSTSRIGNAPAFLCEIPCLWIVRKFQ
jgi:hypothetical protein